MKFGKQLELCELPKFRGNYIQYKELKKALKVFTGQDKDTATVEEVTHWTSSFLRLGPNPELPPEARLNEVLTRELQRISNVVELQQAAIRTQLETLLQDAKKGKDTASLVTRLEEVGDDVVSLKSFSQMNFSGFRKILKKYDKWSKKSTMPWYMSQVVKAPLMTSDYDGFLRTLQEVARILRQKGAFAPQPRSQRKSVMDELCPADASQELVFLVEVKDTMQVRVQMAMSMDPKYPPAQAAPPVGTAGAKPPRPKTTAVFLDTPSLDVYSANIVGVPAGDETAVSGPSCASTHIRRSDAGQVVSTVYQAKGDPRRTEVLLGRDDAAQVLKGQAPRAILSISTPGAVAAAGAVEAADSRSAMGAIQQVQQAVQGGMAPMAQATYLRSLLKDDSGVVAALDEEVRLAKVKDWDGAAASLTDYFPYNVLTVVYPPGAKISVPPRWLQKIYDNGLLLKVPGFSKAAHAMARFHGLGAGLPCPHWYQTVLSSGRATEENEPPPSQEPSEGSVKSGSGKEVVSELGQRSHQGWTQNSVRLLHEFGTNPQKEEEMAAMRAALARGDVADGTVPAPDANSLNAPLLAGSSSAPQATAEVGVFQRLFGGPQDDLDKPVRRAIVAVQPKTLYSNERTFLEWIHFGTIAAAAGVLMLHATGEPAHVMIGRLLILAAIFLIVWAMHVFNWRADGLDYKVDMRYEDNVGPVVLVFSVLGALLFSSLHAVGVIS